MHANVYEHIYRALLSFIPKCVIIAPDQIGYGISTGNKSDFTSLHDWIEVAYRTFCLVVPPKSESKYLSSSTIDQIPFNPTEMPYLSRTRNPFPNISSSFIFGHSLGCVITLFLSILHPETRKNGGVIMSAPCMAIDFWTRHTFWLKVLYRLTQSSILSKHVYIPIGLAISRHGSESPYALSEGQLSRVISTDDFEDIEDSSLSSCDPHSTEVPSYQSPSRCIDDASAIKDSHIKSSEMDVGTIISSRTVIKDGKKHFGPAITPLKDNPKVKTDAEILRALRNIKKAKKGKRQCLVFSKKVSKAEEEIPSDLRCKYPDSTLTSSQRFPPEDKEMSRKPKPIPYSDTSPIAPESFALTSLLCGCISTRDCKSKSSRKGRRKFFDGDKQRKKHHQSLPTHQQEGMTAPTSTLAKTRRKKKGELLFDENSHISQQDDRGDDLHDICSSSHCDCGESSTFASHNIHQRSCLPSVGSRCPPRTRLDISSRDGTVDASISPSLKKFHPHPLLIRQRIISSHRSSVFYNPCNKYNKIGSFTMSLSAIKVPILFTYSARQVLNEAAWLYNIRFHDQHSRIGQDLRGIEPRDGSIIRSSSDGSLVDEGEGDDDERMGDLLAPREGSGMRSSALLLRDREDSEEDSNSIGQTSAVRQSVDMGSEGAEDYEEQGEQEVEEMRTEYLYKDEMKPQASSIRSHVCPTTESISDPATDPKIEWSINTNQVSISARDHADPSKESTSIEAECEETWMGILTKILQVE
ncbi:hypothetical protein ADUPG1_010337 [Aduncisulcus paluster]|uniref:Uncharacterized protein n=1 Tax=Aduncisulcus paluster TaxID=2918883 RepID=A0ABQ5JQY4_9EUKA|nr:hypothetical protein ADUPG1_010337 [Aduncisulcus paluster]